jgi:hypothetical protein
MRFKLDFMAKLKLTGKEIRAIGYPEGPGDQYCDEYHGK